MVAKVYAAFCCMLAGLFFYANSIGWEIIDLSGSSRSKPTGARMYHK